MPSLVTALIVSLIIISMLDPSGRHGAYRAPVTGVLGTFLYGLGMVMLSLPSAIITCAFPSLSPPSWLIYHRPVRDVQRMKCSSLLTHVFEWHRAITTPYKLPYFKPIQSLRVLLTPTERRRPWILYLTPGLLLTQLLHVAYVVSALRDNKNIPIHVSLQTFILGPLHRFLVPMKSEFGIAHPDTTPLKLAIYFAVVVTSTIILTPLEVITTRLAIQRNHASSEYNSVSQEVEGEAEEVPEFVGVEDVIGYVET